MQSPGTKLASFFFNFSFLPCPRRRPFQVCFSLPWLSRLKLVAEEEGPFWRFIIFETERVVFWTVDISSNKIQRVQRDYYGLLCCCL
jgi:hypothetical protein